jgi:hypothetical protein
MALTAKYHQPDMTYSSCEYDWLKKQNLTDGAEYDVEKVDMGQSYTSITLVGIKGGFNSVWFEFFEDGKPIDIYRDARYNPYIKQRGKLE